MEQRFPTSLMLSGFVHLLVLSLFFVLVPQPSKPVEKLVTIDLLTWDGPVGDQGAKDRPAPKQKILQVPRQVGKSVVHHAVAVPQPKTAPKLAAKSVDLRAALSERFKHEDQQETERASALGAAADGSDLPQAGGEKGKEPGGAPGGASGTGGGVSGQLATRGILRRVLPDYPSWAERKWLEGDVRLRLWVNSTGEVVKAQVIGMSGTRDFDRNAAAALKLWRFSPIHGDEVQSGEIIIQYRLGQ